MEVTNYPPTLHPICMGADPPKHTTGYKTSFREHFENYRNETISRMLVSLSPQRTHLLHNIALLDALLSMGQHASSLRSPIVSYKRKIHFEIRDFPPTKSDEFRPRQAARSRRLLLSMPIPPGSIQRSNGSLTSSGLL